MVRFEVGLVVLSLTFPLFDESTPQIVFTVVLVAEFVKAIFLTRPSIGIFSALLTSGVV